LLCHLCGSVVAKKEEEESVGKVERREKGEGIKGAYQSQSEGTIGDELIDPGGRPCVLSAA
jgi:hypothetical protein